MLIVIAVYVVDSGSEQTVEQLLNCGLMSLVSENQRPSIRMLAEWMLIILSTSFRQIAIPFRVFFCVSFPFWKTFLYASDFSKKLFYFDNWTS